MQTPYNLRLVKYLNGSAEIAWDGSLLKNQSFVVLTQHTSGVWGEYANTKHKSAVISGAYTAVSVAVSDGSSLGDESNILMLSITNATNINQTMAIGQDDSGQLRLLATTAEGVLRVTGATVNNYGGDASAANQNTHTSQLNSINDKLLSLAVSTDAALTKLSNIGLNNTSVNALKSVAVTNQPDNYPDADTLAAINALTNTAAKDSSIQSLRDATNSLLKASDLSTDYSKNLKVRIMNHQSDYPDAAVENALLDTNAALSIANEKLDESNTALGALNTNTASSASNLAAMQQDLQALLAALLVNNSISLNAFDEIKPYAAELAMANTSLISLLSNTAGLLKTNDLDISNDKRLITEIANQPDNYPDEDALAALSLLASKLSLLTDACLAHFDSELPEGQNHIGAVSIASLPLPTDAASESTLQQLKVETAAIKTSLQAMTDLLEIICAKAALVEAKLSIQGQHRVKLLETNITLTEPGSNTAYQSLLELAQNLAPAELVRYKSYEFIILSYDTGFDFELYYTSGLSGRSYRHCIKGLSLEPRSIEHFQLSMPIASLALRVDSYMPINTGGVARLIIYGNN